MYSASVAIFLLFELYCFLILQADLGNHEEHQEISNYTACNVSKVVEDHYKKIETSSRCAIVNVKNDSRAQTTQHQSQGDDQNTLEHRS